LIHSPPASPVPFLRSITFISCTDFLFSPGYTLLSRYIYSTGDSAQNPITAEKKKKKIYCRGDGWLRRAQPVVLREKKWVAGMHVKASSRPCIVFDLVDRRSYPSPSFSLVDNTVPESGGSSGDLLRIPPEVLFFPAAAAQCPSFLACAIIYPYSCTAHHTTYPARFGAKKGSVRRRSISVVHRGLANRSSPDDVMYTCQPYHYFLSSTNPNIPTPSHPRIIFTTALLFSPTTNEKTPRRRTVPEDGPMTHDS